VKQFKPEELKVNITDSTISVSAKHEDKKDQHNFSCQEFSRSHTLPPGVKADDVKCELSSDGVLTISAPKPVQKSRPSRETNIPIQHIVPAIRV
jgi:HSP20 family molecular chaperone IbpA